MKKKYEETDFKETASQVGSSVKSGAQIAGSKALVTVSQVDVWSTEKLQQVRESERVGKAVEGTKKGWMRLSTKVKGWFSKADERQEEENEVKKEEHKEEQHEEDDGSPVPDMLRLEGQEEVEEDNFDGKE